MSDIGSEEFEEDEGINLGVSEHTFTTVFAGEMEAISGCQYYLEFCQLLSEAFKICHLWFDNSPVSSSVMSLEQCSESTWTVQIFLGKIFVPK